MADGRTLLLVLVMLSFGMDIMGYPSMASALANSWFGITGTNDMGALITAVVATMMGASLVAIGGGSITSSFGLMYTIPATIAQLVLLGLFLVPYSFIVEASIPLPVRALMSVVFGVFILVTMISFTRGGEI